MDGFQFTLILSFIAGAGLIIYSMINFHGSSADSSSQEGFDESLLIGRRLSEFENSVASADNAISDLNDMSKVIFKQFDEKYEELLFLYNLVDEKKQELTGISAGTHETAAVKKKIDVPKDDSSLPVFKNHRFSEILKMQNDGMSVSEIAKALNIGQGEVSLILELGKGRRG